MEAGRKVARKAGQNMKAVDGMTEPWQLEELRQARWTGILERSPRCALCGEPILQEKAVRLGEEWYCDQCLRKMRQEVRER